MFSRKAPHPYRSRVRLTSGKPTVDHHCKFAHANRCSHRHYVFSDDGSAWCMMSVINCHDDRQKKTSCVAVISYFQDCRDSHAVNSVMCGDLYASGELAKNTGTVAPRMLNVAKYFFGKEYIDSPLRKMRRACAEIIEPTWMSHQVFSSERHTTAVPAERTQGSSEALEALLNHRCKAVCTRRCEQSPERRAAKRKDIDLMTLFNARTSSRSEEEVQRTSVAHQHKSRTA